MNAPGVTAPGTSAPEPAGANGPVVGIVGVGAIGGSIGLRARSLGVTVYGFDRAEVLEDALALGAIDAPVPSFEEILKTEILVLAVSPAATTVYLSRILVATTRPPLVIDVASIKDEICRSAAGLAGFVGTHPLAGTERAGISAARADLFAGRSWAYVPSRDAVTDERAVAFIRAMGATPIAISATAHDAAVARTSHLPQLLAVALGERVAAGASTEGGTLSGPGLASMLRLASSPWPLWSEILERNVEPVADELRTVAATLTSYAAALERGDATALEEAFARAASATTLTAPPAATARAGRPRPPSAAEAVSSATAGGVPASPVSPASANAGMPSAVGARRPFARSEQAQAPAPAPAPDAAAGDLPSPASVAAPAASDRSPLSEPS